MKFRIFIKTNSEQNKFIRVSLSLLIKDDIHSFDTLALSRLIVIKENDFFRRNQLLFFLVLGASKG